MPLGYFGAGALIHVMSTGAIILLAGILMMLTATWLLMQRKSHKHRATLFARLLK
jgi:hypothetical protein